ncbi:MAG: TetR family transcriptional regulator [Gemmatimonadaceae bacterium]|nr:TetR family transcriptional regulator [Gemmatimonadaceae bacterium]
MSNKSALNVRKVAPADPRIARSTRALGAALVELMLEEKFDNITVQSILDRADVGRSTFYAHFRNKHDVLHTSYERMFGWLEQQMDVSAGAGVRIAPVAEFAAHLADAEPLLDALRTSGQLQQISELGVDFLAGIIERHIRSIPGSNPPVPASLVARMLAGALMQMFEWFGERRASATPAQMDAMFHSLARTWLLRASYEPVS